MQGLEHDPVLILPEGLFSKFVGSPRVSGNRLLESVLIKQYLQEGETHLNKLL